ncbi:VanZ family protein [Paenarthrobacter ureafaciens]|uniref:VanZ family protein n=1 Tax=Paenarthrobacter ureafaciens TaxID=37931 RepID=UPI00140E5475|nr:VanZ family protein [Paenarthrobacter ureafaciens]MCX8455785.1 VanZ family protein [Paenarthrobacter ureafaciens]MCY0972626.1 VanZ family protein [Paenarthrobacter ureafaciens]
MTTRDLTPRLRRRGLQAAFGVYLVTLALVVFLPSKEASAVTGFLGIIAGWLATLGMPFKEAAAGVEFVSNIVMFVPFGGLATFLWPSRWNLWRMLLLGASTSTFIELTQLLIPGRVTALSDLIANTAGAVIGAAGAAWMLRRRVRHGSADVLRGPAYRGA